MNKNKQVGFTLVELMISTALSLSVISSILIGYLATYTSTVDTLAASRLNQDVNTVMSIMIGDLRRAGYSASAVSATSPASNPFNQLDLTALEVYDSIASNTQVSATGSGTCIVYAYDANEDGVVDAAELSGFRLNNGVVQMRTIGNTADPDTCATANNTWVDLTDSNFITASVLTFDLSSSECLNTREPDGLDNDGDSAIDNAEEYDCYDAPLPTAGSGNITVETRQITVTLTANLANDSFVRLSQTQNVRVRNELVRVR